jgi:hypothetical protein
MTHRNCDPIRSSLKHAILLLTLVALVLPASTVHAQKEDRSRGFYLGIKFIASSLHVDEDGESDFFVKDDGGGIQLHAGYSFNRVFSLELAVGGANHETSVQSIDADFALFQLFVHYRFSPGRAFRPYIKGGVGGYGLVLKDNEKSVRIDGGGVPLGGGFDYFFSKHFSLGVDLTHNIISYDEVKVDFGEPTDGLDIDQAGAMTSLGLALAYYF